MRRIVVLGLVAVMLMVATSASAQWYMGLRLAGTAEQEGLFDEWYWSSYYRDMLQSDNDGIIDNTQMIFGYGMDSFDVELNLGYSSEKLSYDSEEQGRYTEDVTYTKYIIGLSGLYHLMGNDTVGIDGGLRFQLESESWKYEADATRDDWEDKLSGWSVGPVLRGRWYLADGAIALGPEVFFKYTSKTYTYDYTDRADYELDVTGMGLEYALRVDFMF